MECCVEQLFRLPTTRILAWSILVSPSTGTNRDHFLQADSRTYTQDAQLHYFRVADDSG